jgi:hypothetical protein
LASIGCFHHGRRTGSLQKARHQRADESFIVDNEKVPVR